MTKEQFYQELQRRGYELRFVWPAGTEKPMSVMMRSSRGNLLCIEATTFEEVLAELHDSTDVAGI